MKEANLYFKEIQHLFENILFTGFYAKDSQQEREYLVVAKKDILARKDASLIEDVIRYLKNSSHSSILKLKNAFWERNTLYFLFENFSGLPLSQLIKDLSLEEKIMVFINIVKFLVKLHQENRVFLGLNPQTILLDPQSKECKFFDFSHSVQIADTELLNFSEQYLSCHSAYLAPEQTGLLAKKVSFETDLYMLGTVVYELFTGVPPYQAADISKLFHLHLAGTPVALKQINPQISDELNKLILKLLEKEPEKRFPHAMSLLEVLEHTFSQGNTLPTGSWETSLDFPEEIIGQDELFQGTKDFNNFFRANSSFILILGKSGTGKSFILNKLQQEAKDNQELILSIKADTKYQNTPFALSNAYFDDNKLLDEIEDYSQLLTNRVGHLFNLIFFPALLKRFKKTLQVKFLQFLFPQAELSKEQRLGCILAFYAGMSAVLEKKMVLLLDDLSWVDKNSVQYLCRFYENNEKLIPLKFIFTLSEENFQERFYDFFPSSLSKFLLSPWKRNEIEYFLKKAFANKLELSKKNSKWFLHNTLGNPLVVKETLKYLWRENFFYSYKNIWYLDEDKISKIPVLPDISNLFEQYLHVFEPEEKYFLALAAVNGRRFLVKEILELAVRYESFKNITWSECVTYFFGSLEQSEKNNQIDSFIPNHEVNPEGLEKKLIAVFEKGVKFQLLSKQDSGFSDAYAFPHGYFYDNCARFIPPLAKNKLHALKARMLIEYYHENQDDGIYDVVFHYNQIESDSKLFYYQKLYYNNLAYQKALQDKSIEKAIYYLKEIVDYSLRVGFMDQFIIQLQLKLSQYLILQAQFAKAQYYLKLALETAQKNKWSQEEQQVYLQKASVNYYLKKPDAAIRLYQKVMKIAHKNGNVAQSCVALTYIGATYFFSSQTKEAAVYFEKAVETANPSQTLDVVFSHGMRGWLYLWQGHLKKAFFELKVMKEKIGLEQDPIVLSSYYHMCAVIYSLSGVNLNKALHYSYLSSWHAGKAESALFEYSAYASRMWTYFYQGDDIKALRAIHKAQELAKSHQIRVGFGYFQAYQSEIYFRRGDFSLGYQLAIEELEKSNYQEDKAVRMIYYKIIAAYLILKGELNQALEWLNKGLDLYREIQIAIFGIPLFLLKRLVLVEKSGGLELKKLDQEVQDIRGSHEGIELIFDRAQVFLGIISEARDKNKEQKNSNSPISSFKEKMQLKNIMRLSQYLSNTKNVNDLLQVMLKKFIEMTGAQRGALILVNQGIQDHAYKYVQNIELMSDEFEIPEKIIQSVKSKKMGLILAQANLLKSSDSLNPVESHTGSLLCEPLLYGQEVLGILYLDHQQLKNLFSEEDQQLLRIFTLQAAVAIKNAVLLQQIGVVQIELDSPTQKKIMSSFDLTKREMEVLLFLLKGYSNRQISEQSFISMSTVKTHISHIYEKMRIQNRDQLLSFCQKMM